MDQYEEIYEGDLSEYDLNPSDILDYNFSEDDYENEFNSFEENYINCILPTLADTFQNFLYTIIIVNVSLKISIIINDALDLKWRRHFDSLFKILGGLYLICDFFRDAIHIGNLLVLSILVGTLIVFLVGRYQISSKYVWLFCLSLVLVNELLIFLGNLRFRRLRAIIMLLFMKFISLFNNLEIKENQASFLNCLTYVLHPQCLPLGGWNPFIFSKHTLKSYTIFQNFFNYFKPFVLSIFALLCSNCIISHLMSLIEYSILPLIYSNAPSWFYFAFKGLLNAYFVALQFRCSHYFISYTMQYIHYLWDYDVQVTKPLSIEFPRSLVEVVIVWNIPMHEWLKDHLYKSLSFKFGDTSSRFLTFALSSLIHGYDFRIWSVLITLAFLTWIEMRLRKKLSIRMNGCIEARSCRYEVEKCECSWFRELFDSITKRDHLPGYKCKKHRRTPYNSLLVNLINLFFSILCIIHLAFLGSAFDGKESNSTLEHVHRIWSFLNYYSLILFVPTFVIYKLI